MSSLSNQIELYLKQLLEQNTAGIIEIQRSILSEYFHCVPSQINYVLSTRFTPAHGYIVETRRGGGGYVRIVSLHSESSNDLWQVLVDAVGDSINENESEGLCDYLLAHSVLTRREVMLINSMLKDRVLSLSAREQKDILRAQMLQQLLATLGRGDL